MITSLYPDGKNFIGEAKILSTPMGEIVKNLLDEGAKLGVSSRGMGSLNQKNGANYVRNDFYLATAARYSCRPLCSKCIRRRYYGRKRVGLEQWFTCRGRISKNEG